MANSSHWPHIKCDLGPVGLIQVVVWCGQRLYYREVDIARSRTCAKASRHGKTSFVRQRQSSIKKDTPALRFPISCEPLVSKKAGSTGTLRAKKSLRETRSTTHGKLHWMRALKEQRRSRIPLIVSNKSCGTFATDVQDWSREAARCSTRPSIATMAIQSCERKLARLSVPCLIVCNQLPRRGDDEVRCVPISIRRNWPP